jgi:hypothetical protein
MANYFSKYPSVYYSFDDYKTSKYVTNILSRFSLESALKENISVFYSYDIRDGDTPEILASKLYGSSERHWMVLAMNDIVDPQFDWPLQYETLIAFVDEKYMANTNSNTPGAGLSWSRENIQSYYRVETTTMPGNIIDVKEYEIDANTYDNTVISLNNSVTLSDNTVVIFDTTKITKSYYEHEFELNEQKRKIKLIKPEFVAGLETELEQVFL